MNAATQEASPGPSANAAYTVTCASCHRPFDAMVAAWCSCLVTERTLVCPNCGVCFCKAARDYKSRFWSGAPRALWDEKFLEHRMDVDEEPEPGGRSGRPLVLVVDDEAPIRRVAVRVVRALGCRVAWASDGRDGLARARELKPDLVLTDALMPRLDGRELARLLKSDPATAGARVVLMTALYTSVKYRVEGHKTYLVDDYVAKPVSARELSTLLERYLGDAIVASDS
jgi:CheY-like chemotaxis protein